MDDFENKLTELHDRVLSKALTEDEQNSYTESLFESIKHINEYGEEFWYARELQRALEYTEWRNLKTIRNSRQLCQGRTAIFYAYNSEWLQPKAQCL